MFLKMGVGVRCCLFGSWKPMILKCLNLPSCEVCFNLDSHTKGIGGLSRLLENLMTHLPCMLLTQRLMSMRQKKNFFDCKQFSL